MTGSEYANRIASYVLKNYGDRGVEVYRELSLGKTIIGKNRRMDILVINMDMDKAFCIECKFQDTQGTVDEKIPYALADMESVRTYIPGCIAYAGGGLSVGVQHMLQASTLAAYCLPPETLARSSATEELDHLLAMTFHWWDLLIGSKRPFRLS
jgi:hypothetical protein